MMRRGVLLTKDLMEPTEGQGRDSAECARHPGQLRVRERSWSGVYMRARQWRYYHIDAETDP